MNTIKIQQTTVVPSADDKTRLELQISEQPTAQDSADYVLISVEISDASSSTSLQWLQARALTQVIATLSGIASELERRPHAVASSR